MELRYNVVAKDSNGDNIENYVGRLALKVVCSSSTLL